MNKKAESFQEYLDKRKLKDFAVEEIAKDPLETAVFRSHMQLENARLPIIVILEHLRHRPSPCRSERQEEEQRKSTRRAYEQVQ